MNFPKNVQIISLIISILLSLSLSLCNLYFNEDLTKFSSDLTNSVQVHVQADNTAEFSRSQGVGSV